MVAAVAIGGFCSPLTCSAQLFLSWYSDLTWKYFFFFLIKKTEEVVKKKKRYFFIRLGGKKIYILLKRIKNQDGWS